MQANRRDALKWMGASSLVLTPFATALAQQGWQPRQAIEYIAPANPGGGWDTLIRTTARVIGEERLSNVNFAPVNTPGGGGAVAWAQINAKRGNPHVLFAASPPIILVPLAGQTPLTHRNFTPIARLITDYSIILVRGNAPYQSAKDLFDAIKARPNLSVAGGSAPGSMDHISIAGAASAAGINARQLNYIAFSGGGEAMTNLLGGHVEAVITGAGEAQAQLRGGQVKALAISGPQRMSTMPDVPTLQEQGINFTFDIWRGIMGAPNMPAEAVAYYQSLYERMLKTPTWAAARDQLGWIDAFQGSQEFGAFLDAQQQQFSSVLRDLGLARS
jgi:putative tricarboxylic transport membrane protein